MKKILYISFYFEPDLCAGSFRNTPVAKQLAQRNDLNVQVVTTMPNRYNDYSILASSEEVQSNLNIKRFKIPKHKSSIFDQIFSFAFFYFKVKKFTSDKKYDLVFASTSRFFSGFLACQIASKLKVPLYLM